MYPIMSLLLIDLYCFLPYSRRIERRITILPFNDLALLTSVRTGLYSSFYPYYSLKMSHFLQPLYISVFDNYNRHSDIVTNLLI